MLMDVDLLTLFNDDLCMDAHNIMSDITAERQEEYEARAQRLRMWRKDIDAAEAKIAHVECPEWTSLVLSSISYLGNDITDADVARIAIRLYNIIEQSMPSATMTLAGLCDIAQDHAGAAA